MASKSVIVLSFVFLIALFGIAMFFDQKNIQLSEATGLVVSLESFPVYMETHPIMKDIPKDAAISLEIGGQAYGISNKRIIKDEIISNPDIFIGLPEGYESRIGEIGLCSALNEAIKGGELNFETYVSNTKLITKYYKLIKYKKCLDK